jgi:tetratricopeptide (TPR) repeat protein
MHYIKACHLKMAWGHLIFGRLSQFHHSMSMVKSQGQSITEEDKQALIEARRKTIPHPKLLIARLLFDGGYNRLALQYIQPLKASDFHSALEKTEYCYRKGRIYQSLNQNTLAIAFYEAAISTGKILEVYYASYACIYIAEINEDQGNRTLALKYYKLATSFKNNSEYVQSIEQKAASGIRRLK